MNHTQHHLKNLFAFSKRELRLFVLICGPLFIFGFSSTAFAQDFVPLARIPGLTDMSQSQDGLALFFNHLYTYLIGLAATLAVLQIMRSGIEIATHQDNVSSITDGKKKIYAALSGLALVLAPAMVFSIINPNILNLSVSLPPIDLTLRSATPVTTTPSSGPTPTRTSSSNGSVMDLYRCTDAGDCEQAKLACRNAGGFVGQSYCVDQNNQIVSSGKLYFGYVRDGNGCEAGLVPAMKCTPP